MHEPRSTTTSASTRRDFLRQALFATSAGGLLATAVPTTARAAEPIERNQKPYMKLSLAAYSFRQFLGGNEPTMTMEDFIDKCAEYNLDGCELTSYWFPKEITNEYLLGLKQKAFRLGLDISGTAIGNDFCIPPSPERDAQLELCRRWIDYAAVFGAPVIRIFAGRIAKGSSEAEALDLCVAGIEESLKYAAQKGVILALENHGGITSTPDQLLAIVKRVSPSPWFGVNFDSGNFRTDDPYGDLARIAPYAVNAQIKTEIAPGGKKEEADLERLVKILADANYRGYVVLEYEAAEDPLVAVPRHLDTLRKLLGR